LSYLLGILDLLLGNFVSSGWFNYPTTVKDISIINLIVIDCGWIIHEEQNKRQTYFRYVNQVESVRSYEFCACKVATQRFTCLNRCYFGNHRIWIKSRIGFFYWNNYKVIMYLGIANIVKKLIQTIFLWKYVNVNSCIEAIWVIHVT